MKDSNLKNNKRILFSANLGFLYKEKTFIERIESAKKDGFDGIECHWPYNIPITEVQNVLSKTRLPLISINTNPGNIKKGFFGFFFLCIWEKKTPSKIHLFFYSINPKPLFFLYQHGEKNGT